MMERIWHPLEICPPEGFDTSFEFTDPHENDYWEMYSLIIETVGGISMEYTARDQNEDIHQAFVEVPIVFGEWEDEDERE